MIARVFGNKVRWGVGHTCDDRARRRLSCVAHGIDIAGTVACIRVGLQNEDIAQRLAVLFRLLESDQSTAMARWNVAALALVGEDHSIGGSALDFAHDRSGLIGRTIVYQDQACIDGRLRSEEHTSELQSLMR